MIYGKLGEGKHFPLSSWLEEMIKTLYPDADGNFVGYQEIMQWTDFLSNYYLLN